MTEAGRRPGWTATLTVCALPAANLFLFGPHTVYAHNADEFRQGFSTFAPALLGLFGAAAVLATLVVRLLPKPLRARAVTLAFSLGLLTWGCWAVMSVDLARMVSLHKETPS